MPRTGGKKTRRRVRPVATSVARGLPTGGGCALGGSDGVRTRVTRGSTGRRGQLPRLVVYVVFGRTIDGQDVVDRISQIPVQGDQAIDPVRIISVEVSEA